MAKAEQTESEQEIKDTPLTEARVHEILNAALAGRDKRMKKDLSELLEQSFASFKEQAPKEDKPVAQADDAKYGKLQKQLEDLQKQLKEKEDAAIAMKRAGYEKDSYASLKKELSGKVRPDAEDIAADYIFHAKKKVHIDDDGNASWKEGEAISDLASGVKNFLKSKEAGIFLPAPAAKPAPSQGKSTLPDLSSVFKSSGNENKPLSMSEAIAKTMALTDKSKI